MSARKTGNGEENVYSGAQEWVERALQADGSLFTPDRAIWASRWLEELHYHLAIDPPVSGFHNKVRAQLEGSPPEVCQLMAEALYFHYLIRWVGSVKSDTKEARINDILACSGEGLQFPANLIPSLTPGIANMGGTIANLDHFVGYLIEFVERWKEESEEGQKRLLADPWAFKAFSDSGNLYQQLFQAGLVGIQRNALLHLVFPDVFEPVVSENHKQMIVHNLSSSSFVNQSSADIDRRILQIRQTIEMELGRDFDFYDRGITERWWFTPPGDGSEPPTYGDPLESLAAETYLPVDFLQEIELLLEDRKQIIFHGPPGTGKTYVARKLARALARADDRVELVQFHPSYAYEDFIQGFRPRESGDGFDLRDGPLLRIADRARKDDRSNYFLIIDEINRGNLGKILGELYFLLEYRDEEINLQYSDKRFSLPENLYMIGTMNTADRSIALVDLALRRRFYFKEFHPGKLPVKDVLRSWLAENAPNLHWVADLVDEANRRLGDDDAAIGPSYFMRKGLDQEGLRLVWQHSVLPYIEERLFGESDRLAAFDLDSLLQVTSGGAQDSTESETAQQGGSLS